MKKILVLFIPFLILVGCGTGSYEKAMDEAKSAIENGEFQKAAEYLDKALEERPKDQEANKLHDNLQALNQVMDSADPDEAVKKAKKLMKEETVASSIKKELNKYIQTTDETASGVNSDATGSTSDEAATEKTEAATSVNKRDEYLQKLKNVEQSLADLEKVLENGTQTDMNQAQGEIYKKWDQALNEIYGVLEKQLSTSEMSRIREEQRAWIKRRDAVVKDETLPYKGGSMEKLQYFSSLARTTKERCYELVGSYMK